MTKQREETLKKLGVKETKDGWGKINYKPQGKTEHRAPQIIEEFKEMKVDEVGKITFVRMYKCQPFPGNREPRIFIADVYDKTFVPAHKNKKILPEKRSVLNYVRKSR